MINELLKKLSNYNIFNYLFPGIVFVILLNKITSINLIQDNIILGAFFYYFIGLIMSRIGSVIIEPILSKIGFINFAEYKDFIKVSKVDEKLDILSEVNNMYRTIIALFVSLGIGKLYDLIFTTFCIPIWINISTWVLLAGCIFCLFLFSYRKQTQIISNRVNSNMTD